MAHRYRELTPEERDQVLRQRAEHGYPLHAPPHPFRQAGYYLITAANFEHAPIMGSPERRSDIEARLLAAMQAIPTDTVGWVVLPNHYHLLIGVSSLDLVSAALKQLHGVTSRAWNQADAPTGRRRVWYKFADRLIRDEAHHFRALNYIHYNPVKHGYLDQPYHWPWSSIHNYFETQGQDTLREMWKAYPPGDFSAGWDD